MYSSTSIYLVLPSLSYSVSFVIFPFVRVLNEFFWHVGKVMEAGFQTGFGGVGGGGEELTDELLLTEELLLTVAEDLVLVEEVPLEEDDVS